MKSLRTWIPRLLIGLLVLLAIAFATVYVQTEWRARKTYTVALQPLTISYDSASYQLGKHVADLRQCGECHGADYGGAVFMNSESPVAELTASNLTRGRGGIRYRDQDWIRALRHGLNPQNNSLWFMPSAEVSVPLSNRELGALIGYLKQQPPVDRVLPASRVKPLGRVLAFLGEFPLFAAEHIDHDARPIDEIQVATNATYGAYLATTRMGCHGPRLRGGPPHKPGEPPVSNVSATGHVGRWSAAQFITAIRTGHTPEGRLLSDAMPWKSFARSYNDAELTAIYLYMHSLN